MADLIHRLSILDTAPYQRRRAGRDSQRCALSVREGISTPRYPDASSCGKAWGHRMIDVVSVSYATKFWAWRNGTLPKEYDSTVVAPSAAPAQTTSGKRYAPPWTSFSGGTRRSLARVQPCHVPGAKRAPGPAEHAALPGGSLEWQRLPHVPGRRQRNGAGQGWVALGDASD